MLKECCANCRYCEYKPVGEFHFGAYEGEPDWYCWIYREWLNGDCSGKCRNYEEK